MIKAEAHCLRCGFVTVLVFGSVPYYLVLRYAKCFWCGASWDKLVIERGICELAARE